MRRVWKRAAGVLLSMILLVNMGMTASAKVSYSDLSSDSMILYDHYSLSGNLEELTDALEKYIETGELSIEGFHLSDFDVEDARILLEYINHRNEFQGEWTEQMLEIRKTLPSDWAEYMKWLYAVFAVEEGQGLDIVEKGLESYFETGFNPFTYINIRLSLEEAHVMYDYIKGVAPEEEQEHRKTVNEKIQDTAIREIDKALQTGSNTAVFDGRVYGISTLSRDLMREIDKRGVNLVFKYIYNGFEYEVTIPAGKALDPDIPWYGPAYLAAQFGYVRRPVEGYVKAISETSGMSADEVLEELETSGMLAAPGKIG